MYTKRVFSGFNNNKLTAIEVVGKTKSGNLIWKCKCDCGNFTNVNAAFIKNGKTKSCGCSRKEVDRSYLVTNGKNNPSWKGCGELSADRVGCIRRNAKQRKIYFDLNVQYLWSLYEKQNGKCALSNIDIKFGSNEALDRKDCSLGYIVNNVWWTDRDINFMKYTFNVKEFIKLCELITKPLNDYSHFKTTNSIHKSIYTKYIYSANKRKIQFFISESDIIDKYNLQFGLCAITGQQLFLPQTYKEFKKTNMSIDRINNNLGYVKDNIQIVHKKINISRGKLLLDRYKELASLVYNKGIIL